MLFLVIVSEVIKSFSRLSTYFFTIDKTKTLNNLIFLAVIQVRVVVEMKVARWRDAEDIVAANDTVRGGQRMVSNSEGAVAV